MAHPCRATRMAHQDVVPVKMIQLALTPPVVLYALHLVPCNTNNDSQKTVRLGMGILPALPHSFSGKTDLSKARSAPCAQSLHRGASADCSGQALQHFCNTLTSGLFIAEACNICRLPLLACCGAHACFNCCSDQNVSIFFSLASPAKVSYRMYSHS